MRSLGFVQDQSSPCVFANAARGLVCIVHGYEFVLDGCPTQLKWFKDELAKAWKIKAQIIGEGPGLANEVRVFNKFLRWHPGEGLTLDAGPRHAQIIIRDMGVQKLKPLTTPMTREGKGESDEDRARDIEARRSRGQLAQKARQDDDEDDETNGDNGCDADNR